jgi:hypothetical protein
MKALPLRSDGTASPIRLNGEVRSVQLRERAKHYRYAAAMTDDSRKIQMFLDLAFMFQQMSHDFARYEAHKLPMARPSK